MIIRAWPKEVILTGQSVRLLILTNKPKRASCKQRIGVHLDILHNNGIDYEVKTLPSGVFKRLKLIKHGKNFDGIFLQKKRLKLCDAIWAKCYCRKIIYDIDDAVMYSDKTPERNSYTRKRLFARTAKTADMVIAGNTYLAEHARAYNENIVVLPTGLNLSEYKQKPQKANDGKIRMVWIGSKSTLNYLKSIIPALEEIGSQFDNIVLRIVCDQFFDLKNMEVEKHRWSLETQAGDLAESDIGLAPLPDDRFTRGKCGFKILQYAAASLPVIASPIGANAEYVADGCSGFYASSTYQWIDAMTRLIESNQLRKQMGRVGRENVQHFDLKVIGLKLVKHIKNCIGNS